MLTKTPLHDQIAEKLANREPDWFTVCKAFLKSRPYHHLRRCMQRSNVPLSNFAGHLAEMHIRLSLEEICKELELGNGAVFDAIRPGLRSRKFKFCTNKTGLLYADEINSSYQHYSEMDEVMLIDNVPTLFEVRIKEGKNKGRQGHNRGNAHTMREKRVEHLLEPLKDYFRTEKASFVFIIPPDQIYDKSPVQRKFKERGGILLPFYKDRHAYQEEVKSVLDYLQIDYKKPAVPEAP